MLIAFEGLQGSGKSTIIKELTKQLDKKKRQWVITEWNSDDIVKPMIQEMKRKRYFTPTTYCLLHACEFMSRYEKIILPALSENRIVICDRYYFTALVRDGIRGIEEEYIMNIYAKAIFPDLIVYVDTPLNVANKRKSEYIKKKNLYDTFYYNAGIDVTGLEFEESIQVYKEKLGEEYKNVLSDLENVLILDGTKEPHINVNTILAKINL